MEVKLIGYFSLILQFLFHMPEMSKWIYLQRSCLRKRAIMRVSLCKIRVLLFKSSGFRGTILSSKAVLSGVPAGPGAVHTVLYHAKMDVEVWIQSPSNLPTDAKDQEQITYFSITCLISMIPWCSVLTWENTAPAHNRHSEKAPWGQSMWQDHWDAAVRLGISCLAAQAVFALWTVDSLSNQTGIFHIYKLSKEHMSRA